MPALFLFPSLCPSGVPGIQLSQDLRAPLPGAGPGTWPILCVWGLALLCWLTGCVDLSWVSWGHIRFLPNADCPTALAPSRVEESGFKCPSSPIKLLPLLSDHKILNCHIHQQNPVHCNFLNTPQDHCHTAPQLPSLFSVSWMLCPHLLLFLSPFSNHISHTVARVNFLYSDPVIIKSKPLTLAYEALVLCPLLTLRAFPTVLLLNLYVPTTLVFSFSLDYAELIATSGPSHEPVQLPGKAFPLVFAGLFL